MTLRRLLYGTKPDTYRVISTIDELSHVVTVLPIRHGAREPMQAREPKSQSGFRSNGIGPCHSRARGNPAPPHAVSVRITASQPVEERGDDSPASYLGYVGCVRCSADVVSSL